ncbi:hypothetical protein PFICI_14157 [Pestalotiopsis fici W106-1]|uniref:Uncharacterized protein n=1 Tax=Pestalotiopsis fici (strain W106-1 / CGMCC3.15140) TaxID=1229662 RepID=W3WNA4_PESFW|nr:uncharacterized protein PFICI_14157 [Pestalotiopsis fici W106-1]ETS74291.1 hypothetical protein PFICI_14157 [Pestalotiopsis fici W106-1]
MTKYKPRENKSRNSPGEEPPRNEATNQQYPSNPGPSDQTSYNSPDAMMNPRESSWVQNQPSYYNVAGWSQTTSYGQPMMTPNYGHQSTMNSNSMGQEQWYPNYQVSPTYTAAETTTSTAGWNVSQAPTNTPMMEFPADASDEYEKEDEEEEEARYQDSSERSPTPGNE